LKFNDEFETSSQVKKSIKDLIEEKNEIGSQFGLKIKN
jgi:hypothetical protein